MKLKLLVDIPVSPAYGLKAGMIVDAYASSNPGRGKPAWFTIVDNNVGSTIGIMRYEATEIADPPVTA